MSAMAIGPGRIPQGPPSLPLADRGYRGSGHSVRLPLGPVLSLRYLRNPTTPHSGRSFCCYA